MNIEKFKEELHQALDKFVGIKLFDGVVDKMGDTVMEIVERYQLEIEVDEIIEVEPMVYSVTFKDKKDKKDKQDKQEL